MHCKNTEDFTVKYLHCKNTVDFTLKCLHCKKSVNIKHLETGCQFMPLFLRASTQKEKASQTDQYLVILSSKTYVFEHKLTTYQSV